MCNEYRQNLAYNQRRLTDLSERGAEAISEQERNIFDGDEYRAVVFNKWVMNKRIEFYEAELSDCPTPQNITVFDAKRSA